ncbi:Transcription factor [Wickerhamomyces ciferrii]|uniref:Transcription factor MBP1 n=1 Tax=Wickerhamomyces ciferrii (strain ATCC 14091 / BCRC 22168 / CBS 111 / JCM 3599 / NBRC 0793 / NRRL Y-1031 F-60-10) TaxID=1206466 RepID=K0KH40_WICCF|nr:Transcription factor [Wickerhamomyces ciferrii]CCH44530.1 Transcription factor [Wickerhamomyces ciferrii]
MDNVYSATYSGNAVYEFVHASGSVMRRRSDGWVNATHILKTANFPKAKRTRILERDVQTGVHEKVQGGYGKYQGTWVPLDRARDIAEQFGVHRILAPLFDFEKTNGANSPPPAPKHHHASKNNSIAGIEKPASTKKSIAKKSASMPVAINKESTPSSVTKKRGRPRRLNPPKVPNPNTGVFVGKRLSGNESQNGINDDSLASSPPDSTTLQTKDEDLESEEELNIEDGISSEIDETSNLHFLGSSSSPSDFLSESDLMNALRSPDQRINRSARESLEKAINSHTGNVRNHQNDRWLDANSEYVARLLEYFTSPDDDHDHDSKVPDFLIHPPEGLNVDQQVDDEGHTAFHWACSMGNPQAAEALINLGANYRAVNNSGETPLMRAVLFTNSFNKKSFPRLIELLSESIFDFDSTHKTVLHHIAAGATSKIRIQSALYYMEFLLGKLAEIQSPERLQGYLNLQDNNGDTALHLCAKTGNRKCIKLLLDYKAKTNLKNNQGLIASEILLSNNHVTPKVQQRYETHLRNQAAITQPVTTASTYNIAQPHISEAAIEATHKVSDFLIESLNELSNAYDYELQRKESDVSEVQELLKNMNDEIELISIKTKEYIGEDLDQTQLNQRVQLIEDQVKRQELIAQSKEKRLNNLVEKIQHNELSKLFKNYSNALVQSENLSSNFDDAIQLTQLQLQRKRLVKEMIDLFAGVNGSNEKMQKYTRLISACSDVEFSQVPNKLDDLLHEIEKNP